MASLRVFLLFAPELLCEAHDITVVQMDADDRLLTAEKYVPDKTSENLILASDTEYIIVRAVYPGAGENNTDRRIYQRGDEKTGYMAQPR